MPPVTSEDPNPLPLNEAAAVWLQAGLGPAEEQAAKFGVPFNSGSVKFTWRGEDYEVVLRKL